MPPKLFRSLVALIVVLALAVAVLAGVAVGRGGRDRAQPSSPPPTSPVRSPSPKPTVSPTPTATVSPTPTATPTTSPSTGPAITPAGAVLRPTGNPVNPAPADAPCTALITPGVTGNCGGVDLAGGTIDWVVEQKPAAGGLVAYTTRLFDYSESAGGWVEFLLESDPHAVDWSGVRVVTSDLTGDGAPEIVAGFRHQGSGAILSYDIVTWQPGQTPRVAAHPNPASHGSVRVGGGQIDEYSAQYPNGEPNCCPAYFLHRVIRFVDGAFRVVATGHVTASEVPSSQL